MQRTRQGGCGGGVGGAAAAAAAAAAVLVVAVAWIHASPAFFLFHVTMARTASVI
jgi:hypothetical protein